MLKKIRRSVTALCMTSAVVLPACSALPSRSVDCATLGLCEPLRFVLGQPDEHTNNPLRYGLSAPGSVLVVNNKLLVSDSLNHRILLWNSFPPALGQAPDLVLGQPDLTTGQSNYGGVSAKSLSRPAALASDGKRLLAVDADNNRILIWNRLPTTNFAPADVVVGQSSFTNVVAWSMPVPGSDRNFAIAYAGLFGEPKVPGLAVIPSKSMAGGSMMVVTDPYHHRVMLWDPIPTASNAPATALLGQSSFAAPVTNPNTTDSTFRSPSGRPASDGNRLLIADSLNHRVLSYAAIPTAPAMSLQAAALALGQPDFVSGTSNVGGTATGRTLSSPVALALAGSQLLAVDHDNHRVLLWKTIPTAMQQSADLVIGQALLTTSGQNNGGLSGSSLKAPSDVWSDGTNTVVADSGNNRVLLWSSAITASGAAASRVLGQPSLLVGEANSSREPTDRELRSPVGMCSSGGRFFVVEDSANRILVYPQLPTHASDQPSLVLGQPSLLSTQPQGGGQAVTASTLSHPTSIACSEQQLVVADSQNNRVLIWNRPITSVQQPADVVLGQATFATSTPNSPGPAQGLFVPWAVLLVDGKLLVADGFNNRVLIWNQVPQRSGVGADVVIGQANLTTTSANRGGAPGPSTLSFPQGLWSDGQRLLISDSGNARVLLFKTIPTASTGVADVVIGQASLSGADGLRAPAANVLRQPGGLAVQNGRLYVADSQLHRVLYWNQLPAKNDLPADGVVGQPTMTSYQPNDGGLGLESLNRPTGILVALDTLFIADTGNGRIVARPVPK